MSCLFSSYVSVQGAAWAFERQAATASRSRDWGSRARMIHIHDAEELTVLTTFMADIP